LTFTAARGQHVTLT